VSALAIAWSMVSSVGLLLGVIHFTIWHRNGNPSAFLLAAIMTASTGAVALLQLGMEIRPVHADYSSLLPWSNLAIFAMVVSITWFVHVHLGKGRRWLAIVITAAWAVVALLGTVMSGNLTSPEIDALQVATSSRIEPLALAERIASLLVLIYLVDTAVRAYGGGRRRRALVLGGLVVLFMLIAGLQLLLTNAGVAAPSFSISFAFVVISIAMAIDLLDETTRSAARIRALQPWERRWRSLIEDVQLAVVGVDRDGQINYTNPFFRALTGLPEAQLLDQPAANLSADTDMTNEDRSLVGLPDGNASRGVRFLVQATTGERRDVLWSTLSLRDREGAYDGLLSIGQDVTERRQAQEELQRAQRELEHLTRVVILGEFGSALAEELNGPLATSLASARAAQRLLWSSPPDVSAAQQILEHIVSENRQAGDTITRMQTALDDHEAQSESFDLNAAIAEVLDLMDGEMKEREVVVEVNLAPTAPTIRGGRVEIQQVVSNLVLNGARAASTMPPSKRRMQVETSCGKNIVSIVVQDQGPGVRPDIAPRIFEPFVTTTDAGLGMGLAISRRIVEAHGGRIRHTRPEEGGARFEVFLPLDPGHANTVDS